MKDLLNVKTMFDLDFDYPKLDTKYKYKTQDGIKIFCIKSISIPKLLGWYDQYKFYWLKNLLG